VTGPTVLTAPVLTTVPRVELGAVGRWNISNMQGWEPTPDDFASAVAALGCPAVRRPVLKWGHTGVSGAGDPALGWIDNMAVTEDGQVLVGDFCGIPAWLAAEDEAGLSVLSSAYPDRSGEWEHNYVCQLGHTHPFVLHAMALLGVERPGIGTLQSLHDLYSIPLAKEPPMPAASADGMAISAATADDVRAAYYAGPGANPQLYIREMYIDPPELIVQNDADGTLTRVAYSINSKGAVTFGDPQKVKMQYVNARTASETPAVAFASLVEARPAGQIASAVSDKPWSDFSQADYTDAQWHAACLIHLHSGSGSYPKSDCKLPVKEPGGAVNRNGVHAAAGRLNQVTGITAEQKKAAAKALVGLYRSQLKEDPPQALLDMADASAPVTPVAASAAGAPTTQEGAGMDPAKLREALGLPADASDQDVTAAFAAATATPTPPTQQPAAATPPEPVVPAAGAPPRPAGGVVTIDASQLAEFHAASTRMAALERRMQERDRDDVITAAIKEGKFGPARRAYWERYWDSDPEGAKTLIASLEKNLVPVFAAGFAGGDDAEGFEEAQFDHLFPPGQRSADLRKMGA